MNRLELLRVFASAASAGSFRQAAKRLGASPQTVTRAVAQLEEALGEALFHRTSRQVRLTAYGERLAVRAMGAVAGVDGLFESETKAAQRSAAGVVRVAVPGSLGRRCVVEMLAPTMLANPGLILDVRVSDQLADVVEGKIDVGVRIGRMLDNRFVAKRAALLPFFVVAAPALLQRVVEPDTLEELQHLPLSALIDSNNGRAWPWVFRGQRQLQPHAAAFVTDDPETECAAIVAGLALGQLAGHLALPWIAQGRLKTVLDHLEPDPWPVVVYRPRRTPTPVRVRRVFDALVAGLGEQRWLATRR